MEKREVAIRRRHETRIVLRISFLDGEQRPENGLHLHKEHAVQSGYGRTPTTTDARFISLFRLEKAYYWDRGRSR
jgi:hypothetical protein